jgi:hypothetical protein
MPGLNRWAALDHVLTEGISCKDEARTAGRMESFANGPGVERGPDSPPTNAATTPYLFGAICPARGVEAALALPYADTDVMQLHLDAISRSVAEGADAVLLLDRTGWHTTGKLDVPVNITPIFLPSRAPERRSSIRSRTSGSTCAKPGSRTPSSKTMPS